MSLPRYLRLGDVVVDRQSLTLARLPSTRGPEFVKDSGITDEDAVRKALEVLIYLAVSRISVIQRKDVGRVLAVRESTVSGYLTHARKVVARLCVLAGLGKGAVTIKKGNRGTPPSITKSDGVLFCAGDSIESLGLSDGADWRHALSTRPSEGNVPTLPDAVEFDFGGEINLRMVYIPGGMFRMGRDEFPRGDERPEHWVYLSPYVIAVTPITNHQYMTYVRRRNGDTPAYYADESFNKSTQPVVGLDYYQMEKFLDWLGLDFPTEAQWEFAAKGVVHRRKYPWGGYQQRPADVVHEKRLPGSDDDREDQPRGKCDHGRLEAGGPKEVASFPTVKSWCGLLDMVGGVWEWCKDWYGPYYGHALFDPVGPQDEPQMRCTPVNTREKEPYKVLRGGAFVEPAETLEVTVRGANHPGHVARCDGLRPASAVDWTFLRAHLRLSLISGDIMDEARNEVLSVIHEYRIRDAQVVETKLTENHCTIARLAAGDVDAQYTVISRDGSLVVHRHFEARTKSGRWGDPTFGVNLHALVVSRIQSEPAGVVRWVDNLTHVPVGDRSAPRRDRSQLRISAAAYHIVPGLDRIAIAEVHLHVSTFPRQPRAEWILWFRRGGWYIDVDDS